MSYTPRGGSTTAGSNAPGAFLVHTKKLSFVFTKRQEKKSLTKMKNF